VSLAYLGPQKASSYLFIFAWSPPTAVFPEVAHSPMALFLRPKSCRSCFVMKCIKMLKADEKGNNYYRKKIDLSNFYLLTIAIIFAILKKIIISIIKGASVYCTVSSMSGNENPIEQ
jgi:hypothetical protein